MQYLSILFSSFGEEDFQRFASSNFLRSNCLWLLFRRQNWWHHHLNKLELHIHKDCLCVIYKSNFGEEDFQRFALNLLCSHCL